MNEYENQVLECHKAFGVAEHKSFSKDLLTLRKTLIAEETKELFDEIDCAVKELEIEKNVSHETFERLMKEIADLQYVLSGMVVTFGLPMQEAFRRVHISNMSKLGPDGKPIFREDGKYIKGPNYKKPDLSDLKPDIS